MIKEKEETSKILTVNFAGDSYVCEDEMFEGKEYPNFKIREGVVKMYGPNKYKAPLRAVEITSVYCSVQKEILSLGEVRNGVVLEEIVPYMGEFAFAYAVLPPSELKEELEGLPMFHTADGAPIFEGDTWYSVGLVTTLLSKNTEAHLVSATRGEIVATNKPARFLPDLPEGTVQRFSTLDLAKKQSLILAFEDEGINPLEVDEKMYNYLIKISAFQIHEDFTNEVVETRDNS